MTVFNDLYKDGIFKILSEAKAKDGSIMNVKVPWSMGNVANGNKRIYPTELLTRETNRVQKQIESGAFLGQADHPVKGNTELKSVSHIVRKMWMEKDQAWANLAILDTVRGRDLKTIILAGGKLGISSRGFGEINKNTGVVQNSYQLDNLDIVTRPSYRDGTFSKENVFESLSLTEKKKIRTGSSGAFMKEGIVKKKMIEELNEDGLPEKLAEPKDFYEESKITGIDPIKRAETVNKDREKSAATEKRIAMRKRVVFTSPKLSPEEIDEKTDKLLEAESAICESVKEKRLLDEAEDLKEEQRKKKNKRLLIRQSMHKEGMLAGFTVEQIQVAIVRRMAQLDEEEGL